MQNKSMRGAVLLVILSLTSWVVLPIHAEQEERSIGRRELPEAAEEEITLNQAPAAVQRMLKALAYDGELKEVFMEKENDKVTYEAEIERDGLLLEVGLDAKGDVLEIEVEGGPQKLRSPLLAKDDSENKILDVLDDLTRNQRRDFKNVPEDDGRLLRLLTETSGAKKVVEIGTSNGYSGIWFCLALRKTGGKLITHEIDEGRAKLARENFIRAGVEDSVSLVTGDAHETVKQIDGPIDILFLDADKSGYPDYLKKLRAKVRPGGLIIAHNMRSPAPDPDFIKLITSDRNLDVVFLNMDQSGIGVALKKR